MLFYLLVLFRSLRILNQILFLLLFLLFLCFLFLIFLLFRPSVYSFISIVFSSDQFISASSYFSFSLFCISSFVSVTSDKYCRYASSPAVSTGSKYGKSFPPQTFDTFSVFPPLFAWKKAFITFPSYVTTSPTVPIYCFY